MMRLYSILALAVLAAPALAQRGRFAPEGNPITPGDIERLAPARVVIDQKKALKLEPARLTTLDSLRKAFVDSAKLLANDVRKHQRAITSAPPLLKAVSDEKPTTKKDSLERAETDSTNRMKRDKYFETVTAGRRDLAIALLALKDLFDSSMASTIAALDGSQHTAAALSLERASEEFTRRLRLANIR
jgi:hypothetical protein